MKAHEIRGVDLVENTLFFRFTPYVKSGAEDFILGKDKEQIADADTITIIVSTHESIVSLSLSIGP